MYWTADGQTAWRMRWTDAEIEEYARRCPRLASTRARQMTFPEDGVYEGEFDGMQIVVTARCTREWEGG